MIRLPPISEMLILLPAAVVAGVLLLVSQVSRFSSLRRAGAALALGAGAATGILLFLGRLPEAPGLFILPMEWPFHIALGGTVIGVVLSSSHVGLPVRTLVMLLASAGVAALVLHTQTETGNEEVAIVALAGGAVWFLLDRLAERRPGPTVPFAMSLTGLFAAEALYHGGSNEIAQMIGALAAAGGAAVLVGLLWPRLSLARGGVAVYSVLTIGCLAIGNFRAGLPDESALLVLAAPLAAWAGELPFFRRRSATLRVVVLLVAVSALAFAAVAHSFGANPAEEYVSF
jgi:hypothetical protein